MATYTASATGSHALTANTTALRVTITAFPSRYGNGRANPSNFYDIALLRFSDGTGFWSPVAIQGGPHWIGVPAGATAVYWSCLGGAELSIVEVIGGVNPFYGPNSSLEALADVAVTGIADGQLLAWDSASGLWRNVTPATPPVTVAPAMVKLAETIVSAGGVASVDLAAISQAYRNLQLVVTGRGDSAAQFVTLEAIFNSDSGANYEHDQINMSGGSINAGNGMADAFAGLGFLSGASASADAAGSSVVTIHDYARAFWHKAWESLSWSGGNATSTNSFQSWTSGRWRNTAAITDIVVKLSAGNLAEHSVVTLYGLT